MTDWLAAAKASGFPTFPVRIKQNDLTGKWEKIPLSAHGHKSASWRPETLPNWEYANGFGIPMGQIGAQFGMYAFDLDDYRTDGDPLQWLAAHNVPMDTRAHRTVSGGTHMLYTLPNAHLKLPSRANIVHGLDSRGEGGWVAFGEGYGVLVDLAPVMLPTSVCAAVLAGYTGGGGGAVVDAPPYRPPEAMAVDRRLEGALRLARSSRHRAGPAMLVERFTDGVKLDGDTTASAKDMSLAALLVLAGLKYEEIVFVLLHRFRHGVAARDGVNPVTERAAMRCAAKAVARRHAEIRAAAHAMKPSAESIDAYKETLK